MGGPRIYLDYNATAPVRACARDAALAAMAVGGNPSSVHDEGRRARAFLEAARRQVATAIDGDPGRVCFTSGGTEAANLALRDVALGDGTTVGRLLVGAGEHAAVLAGHGYGAPDVDVVPLLGNGTLDLDRLRTISRSGGPALLALQAANNETGVIQPVREASEIVRGSGGIVVCDAVQAAGRVPCDSDALGADVVLLSGHKLGGIAGAGAVAVMTDRVRLRALVRGGGQERGLRGGTENVPAIAAFGAAAEEAVSRPDGARLGGLRDGFEAELRALAPDAVIFGSAAPRLPNTSAFAVPGVSAERLMMALDLGGVAVSSGSACSSGKVGRSHVLEAMGIGHDLRQGAIRISFGWRSVASEIDGLMVVLTGALRRMRRPLRSAA